ncbi:MAG TPA: hypothetical protein VJI46_02155 [Candidatus Nanoarchaeia archaeon]|nr:hypothetical protein [Candidatus Nanoarchaeia archaeon]
MKMDEGTRKKILELAEEKSAREIAKELRVSRKEIGRILEQEKQKRSSKIIRNAIASAVTLGVLALEGYGGYLHYKHLTIPKPEIRGEEINDRISHFINRYEEFLNGRKFGGFFTGVYSEWDLSNESSNPELAALFEEYGNYISNPSDKGLEHVLKILEGSELVPQTSILKGRMRELKMARRINETYEREKEGLMAAIKTNWESIYNTFKGRKCEQGGYVLGNPKGFSFQYRDYPNREKIIRYTGEFLEGDEERYGEIVGLLTKRMSAWADTLWTGLQIYHEGMDVAEDFRKTLPEELEKEFSEAVGAKMENFAGHLRNIACLSYEMAVYASEVEHSPNVVSHFHTHPYVNDLPDPPSDTDLNASILIGNGLVFKETPKGFVLYQYRNNDFAELGVFEKN